MEPLPAPLAAGPLVPTGSQVTRPKAAISPRRRGRASVVAILAVVAAAAAAVKELGKAAGRRERRERSCGIAAVERPALGTLIVGEGSMIALVAGLAVEDYPHLAHQVAHSMSCRFGPVEGNKAAAGPVVVGCVPHLGESSMAVVVVVDLPEDSRAAVDLIAGLDGNSIPADPAALAASSAAAAVVSDSSKLQPAAGCDA